MSYTKGEWKFNGRDIVIKQGTIGQQRICTIIEHREEYKAEDEANGRRICQCVNNFDGLLEACKDLFDLIDKGILVRNIKDDDNADWAIKQLPLIQTLHKTQAAIAAAEK